MARVLVSAHADSVDGADHQEDGQQPPAATPALGTKADGGVPVGKASGRRGVGAAESGDESDDAAPGRSNAASEDGGKASGLPCPVLKQYSRS